MKTRIFICCVMILSLLFGCRTPKKIATITTEVVAIQEKQHQTNVTESYTFVDTSKKSGFEINYFKVEFYQPDTINQTAVPEINSNQNVKKPPNQGAIKSIEKITIKNNEENAGVISIVENNTVETNTESNVEINTIEEFIEQSVPDWRYIFGICITVLITGIGVFLVLRKYKFVPKIITFLRNFFKKLC